MGFLITAMPTITCDSGDHANDQKPHGAIRRASTCHRERAAQPGVERSKSAKPNLNSREHS